MPGEVYTSQAIEHEEGIDLGLLTRDYVASYVTARTLADGESKPNLSRRLNHVLQAVLPVHDCDYEHSVRKLVDGVLENYGLDHGSVIQRLSTQSRYSLQADTFEDDCLRGAALLGIVAPFKCLSPEAVKLTYGKIRRPTLEAAFAQSLLLNAVRGGNEELIDLVLGTKSNADLLPLKEEAIMVIHCAISQQNVRLVRKLLGSEYVDTNVLRTGRSSLRRIAATTGNAEILQLICRSCQVSEHDEVVLNLAAEHGHRKIVQACLDAGADVDGSEHGVIPPLTSAVLSGHADIVQVLLDRGADQTSYDENEQPLTHAAMRGHTDIVRILLAAGAVPVRHTRFSPLYWAARNAHMSTLEYLLDQEIDIEGRDKYYAHAALMIAACKGYESVLQLLVRRGVDVTQSKDIITSGGVVDGFGLCPMIEAYCYGHQHIVKALLELGAPQLDPFADGYTGPYSAGFRQGAYPRYFGSGIKPSAYKLRSYKMRGSID